jgi:hypothetical protein
MPKIASPGMPTNPPPRGERPTGPAIAISIKSGATKWGDHVTVWVTGDGQSDGDTSPTRGTWKVHLVAGATYEKNPARPIIWKYKDPVAPKTGYCGIAVLIEKTSTNATQWPDVTGPVKHWNVEAKHIHALLKEARRIQAENESSPWVYGTAIAGRMMNCASFAERVIKAAGITYVSAGIIVKTPSELLGAGGGGQLKKDGSSKWNNTTGKYDN